MLVFLCVLSWPGMVYFRSIPCLSWELQKRATPPAPPPSVSVVVTYIICTSLILHLFLMTLDLFVYVVLSDGDSCLGCLKIGTFFRVSMHCAVSLCWDSLNHGWRSLIIIPAYTKSDFTMTYACSMDSNKYI